MYADARTDVLLSCERPWHPDASCFAGIVIHQAGAASNHDDQQAQQKDRFFVPPGACLVHC